MGDVVMTVPVISQVVGSNDVCITILTKKAFAPLFSKLKNTKVIAPDFNNKYKSIAGIWKLYYELKKLEKWDVVIDLHDVLRTKMLRKFFSLSGTKVVVVDKNRKQKRRLTRRFNKKFWQLPLIQDEYSDAFKKAGLAVSSTPYKMFNATEPIPEKLREIINSQKAEKWIGIAPFAKHKNKIYPLNRMEKVVEYFSLNNNAKIFLFGGGKHEKKILYSWEKIYSNTYSLAGKINLEDELRFMAHLDCMLSMDSANMHLANLVDIPVVSVWGTTHPYTGFLSKGNPKNKEVQLSLACRPCSVYGNKPCYKGTNECLNIEPEIIIKAIEEIIE
jgi:ADP-heptose:LPS heptosyltransferase